MITLFLPVSLLLRVSLCLLLVSAAARALRIQHRPEILLLFGDYVQFEDGREARIARHSFVHPALVVLCLEGERARVLFADALDKDQFRRLRVYLRHALDVTENVSSSLPPPP